MILHLYCICGSKCVSVHVCVHFTFRYKIHITQNTTTSGKGREEGKWKHGDKDSAPQPFQVLGFLNILYLKYTCFEVTT